jgi:hypothetical protein
MGLEYGAENADDATWVADGNLDVTLTLNGRTRKRGAAFGEATPYGLVQKPIGLQSGEVPVEHRAIEVPKFQVGCTSLILGKSTTDRDQRVDELGVDLRKICRETSVEQVETQPELQNCANHGWFFPALFALKLVLDEAQRPIGSVFPKVHAMTKPIVVIVARGERLSIEDAMSGPRGAAVVTEDGASVSHE